MLAGGIQPSPRLSQNSYLNPKVFMSMLYKRQACEGVIEARSREVAIWARRRAAPTRATTNKAVQRRVA
jgi:hypothetical protein